MLVAHRNYISVYEMTQNRWFEEKIKFEEAVLLLAVNERG